MTRPARVLWLAKGLGRGGAEQLLTTSARHLDRSRYEVEVAYLLPWKDALVPVLQDAGIPAHCLEQGRGTDLSWVPRLRTLLRQRDYDLVHTHMPVPAAAARLLARKSRTRLVHTEHNVWSRYRTPTRLVNAATYRRNDAVLAVSSAVRDSIAPVAVPRPPASVEVLLHGIDQASARRGPAARARGRALLGLPEDALVVGSVGNLTPKKDQRRMLDALSRLRADLPALVLVLIGTGPLEQELRDHAAALGLGESVRFLGLRDDVPDLLPAFDVFCMSSLHEGLSIALLEALASGVPAVCTDVGGTGEVLTDGVQGRLVPSADTDALVRALHELLHDPALRARCSEAAVSRSRDFDISVATRRLEQLYDEVLARR